MAIPLTSNTNLSHHRGGYAIVVCNRCGHRRDIQVELLARWVGWDVAVRRIQPRFRCSRCQAHDVQISFGYDAQPRGWRKNPS